MAELLPDGTLVRDGKPITWDSGVTVFGDTRMLSRMILERLKRDLIFAQIGKECRDGQ